MILYAIWSLAILADGWSEDIWPSQEYPREGYRQLSECYSGTVERCRAANKTLPSEPTWYRSERSTLVDLKAKLLPVIPCYARTNDCDVNTPVLGPFFAATNGTSVTIPYWSATGLLSFLKMPTNYFAFTPYRGISGLGGNTNDTTVPYPYGWTNAYTQAGGSNFPASRTNWYDTDYGYAMLPDVINSLRWTTNSATATGTAYAATSGTNVVDAASYTAAILDCTNNWAETTWPGAGTWNYNSLATIGIRGYWTPYTGVGTCQQEWYLKTTGIWTGSVHQTEFYAYTTYPTLNSSETRHYTNFGDSVTYDKYAYIGFVDDNSDATNTSPTVGSSVIRDPWPSYAETAGNGASYGYSHTAYRVLIRWDAGFVFK